MSRLIVKGLPKKITEKKLRDLFGPHGNITDVQLKHNTEGVFRQFAFIGFQDESVAEKIIQQFNNTRIQTSQITVEKCEALGVKTKKNKDKKIKLPENDEDTSVTNKKESRKKKDKDDPTKELLEKYKDDPMFSEFLEVHSAKEAQELLKKSAVKEKSDEREEEKNENGDEDDLKEKLANSKISDIDYMKTLVKKREKTEKKPKNFQLFTIKIQQVPYNCTKKDVKGFFKPLVPFTIRMPRKIKGVVYVGFKKEKDFNSALSKNKSILVGRQVLLKKVTKGDEKDVQNDNMHNNKWKSQEESLLNEEGIAESGRIFFRNFAYSATEDDLQKLFEKYGPVTEINIPIDNITRNLKGYGIVTFLMPEHAVKAYTELDGSILHGRMLHLLPGKPKDDNEDNDESSNFKEKKRKQQKKLAGSSHNWNSLFLGHDAVAEVIADTYNTTKEAVLDPHGRGSAAVRLALGETQIVTNTRKYLEEHGVHLDAFNQISGKKSNTVILVKNLPAGTEARELRELFESCGVLSRIIFPPKCLTAIIEFYEPSEAKKAFRRLAYTKFKSLPLYLEWAPENTLNIIKSPTSNEIEKHVEKNETLNDYEKKNETSHKNNGNKNGNETDLINNEEDPEENTTLFVKNLNFKTTDQALKKHFEDCGKVFYATVATKKDPKNANCVLSMGYGFVRFMTKSGADKALKKMQQSILDDKSIEIKRSERTVQNDIKVTRKKQMTKQNGTKILIRNIPFQANFNEIKELFITFGEIKALRLPKKMGAGANSHRGFGFIDYSTNSDAKKAFEALSQSTHLYGRRLVLEWASSEEDVEMLRKRTADHFHETEQVKSKKSVFDIENKS